MTGLLLLAGTASAQRVQQPSGSLVVDPQQGATPRPLPPSPSLPPVTNTPAPTAPVAPSTLTIPSMPVNTIPRGMPVEPAAQPVPRLGGPQQNGRGLPVPSGDPLRIDPGTDPVLRIARTQTSLAAFQQAIGAAVQRNPELDEVNAQFDEADAARREARARAMPTADLSISSFKIIDRAFSNDPRNILERSRPSERTDATARLQQPIVDFGASLARIRAGEARLESARAEIEDTGTQIALRAVSAWYTVYGYRVLVGLAEAFTASQRALRVSIEERVEQGAAAPGDVAQVDSYIASADAQRADFQRQLVGAEAQYAAVIGTPPPADLARAPVPPLDGIVRGTLSADTDKLPAVRAAELRANAARFDARALKSERLPQLSAGIDAGRYGVFETANDYDVRGSVTLSMRLGGGAAERVDQAQARAARADARLRRTRIEVQRDAEIALSDVVALEDAQDALESNYIASRRSRDVLFERFRVSRGTLFDLLATESNYFGVAARYIQSMIELDTARYALLARTGRLLPVLGIAPSALENR
ncbi:MAG TPA: TolC family protein [Sphingomonas sp.]